MKYFKLGMVIFSIIAVLYAMIRGIYLTITHETPLEELSGTVYILAAMVILLYAEQWMDDPITSLEDDMVTLKKDFVTVEVVGEGNSVEVVRDALPYFTTRRDWPLNKHDNYEIPLDEFVAEAKKNGWVVSD